jgi:3-hydroxyanthranilate 3,4-dioxygenase
LEGNITVKTQQNGQCVEYRLGPGDLFLCPARTPHSPVREEGSLGLVIERVRAGRGFTDGLLWFCESCNHPLHEAYFELHDIEKDFLPHFKAFYSNPESLRCQACGHTMETDPRFV